MAIVVVNQMDGADQATYERVSPKVMPDGQLPDGCQLHIAGPTEGGWRVITVWESEERFQTFREQKLIPAMQETGDQDRVAPKVSTNPVHRIITR